MELHDDWAISQEKLKMTRSNGLVQRRERLVEARGVKRKTGRIRLQPFNHFSIYRPANRFNHSEFGIRKIATKKMKGSIDGKMKIKVEKPLYTLEEFK